MNLPLNIDVNQILLHLFNLVILIAALYFILYKPVKDFMEKRKAYYEDMDKKANDKLNEAEEVKKEYEAKLASCDDEIKSRKKDAMDEVAKYKEDAVKASKKEADDIIDAAKKRAEYEHDAMLSNTRKEIAELVTEVAKKVSLGDDVSKAYDDFLNSSKKE